MSTEFTACYLDGRCLASRPVTVRVEEGRLRVLGLPLEWDCAWAEVRVSDRLGRVPRFLSLPNGATLETDANAAIDALLSDRGQGRLAGAIHWLEQRSQIAAAATVGLVVTVAALLYFGLPWAVQRAAYAVPPEIEAKAGAASLATLDRFFAPTALDAARRRDIRVQLDRLLQVRQINVPVRLEFRRLGPKAPNAFALPGGIIVVSDELVALAGRDELTAVLAHEIGHWQRRHGLQGVFRGSAALLFVSTVTGDLSTLVNFSGTLPFVLLQRGYSREFEEEADEYAVATLRQARIDPRHLASILAKLEKARPDGPQDRSYLSTHPATADRIRKIDPTGSYVRLGDKTPDPATAAPAPPDVTMSVHYTPDRAESVDTLPVPIRRVTPVYPFGLRATNVTGTVTLEFVVDTEGNVREPRVVESSHPDLEAPALEAIAQWKFSPGIKGGRKVNTRSIQPFTFSLNDEPSGGTAAEQPSPGRQP